MNLALPGFHYGEMEMRRHDRGKDVNGGQAQARPGPGYLVLCRPPTG